MKRKLHLLGCPTHASVFVGHSQAVKQAVKIVFWQQKIEKDKMQRKQRKKKESTTTQLTPYTYIHE
tara:strand:+ start:43 stop:240 length:198 start_codon:yes stop_codon:yes gene_type:complete